MKKQIDNIQHESQLILNEIKQPIQESIIETIQSTLLQFKLEQEEEEVQTIKSVESHDESNKNLMFKPQINEILQESVIEKINESKQEIMDQIISLKEMRKLEIDQLKEKEYNNDIERTYK